mmetsp:Transcript_30903/g.47372  ORF Transcript_30903/g.47372 Transcript_30903/m.47372 type:complete len:535 (+) Transcript_30903:95-1699(+)
MESSPKEETVPGKGGADMEEKVEKNEATAAATPSPAENPSSTSESTEQESDKKADGEGNAEPGANDGGDEAAVPAPTTTTTTTDTKPTYTPGGGGRGGGRFYRGGGRSGRRHNHHRSRGVYHSDEGSDKSRRVYVGNLSWDVTWRELKDHMKSTGFDVTRADVMASPDGRSKGAGIVEFATEEGARAAVEKLNDTELMGRQIFIREDREDGSSGGYYVQQVAAGHGGGPARHGASGDAQNRRCYVGNLSWDVAWQDLKDHMRAAGDVAYAEVMTEGDGRSKGCGIVEYSTPEEAQAAIQTLSETELKGRTIFVREDRETSGGGGGPPSSGGGGGGGGGGGYRSHQNTSVYVGNLAYETTWMELKDHMRAAGNVDQADVLVGDDGRSKGCGIVQYQRPQDAARAIRELQKSILNGRPIFVREDREAGGRSSGYRNAGANNTGGGGDADEGNTVSGSQLFVRNLSYDTEWKDLKDHFAQCGDVERADVMTGPDGRKKGFGIVRFYNEADAQAAIRKLNGVELQGRALDIKIDRKAN